MKEEWGVVVFFTYFHCENLYLLINVMLMIYVRLTVSWFSAVLLALHCHPIHAYRMNFQKNCIRLARWAQLLLRLQQFFRQTLWLLGVLCKLNEKNINIYTFY